MNPEERAGLTLVQMAQSERKTCPTLKWKALVEAVESPVG